MNTYRKWIVKAGLTFITTIIVLTFFSNTIHSLGLASVTAAFPEEGFLSYTAESEAIVDFIEKEIIYAQNQGIITMLTEKGKFVEEGDELFYIKSDIESLTEKLENVRQELEKNELRIQKAKRDKANWEQERLNLKPRQNEDRSALDAQLSGYNFELDNLEEKMKDLEEELEILSVLYEVGGAAKEEVDKLKSQLESDKREYRQILQKKEKAIEDYENAKSKSEGEARESLESQEESILKSIRDIEFLLAEYAIDKSNLEKETEALNSQIINNGLYTVTAANPGVVVFTGVNIESGAFVDKNTKIMEIGLMESEFYIEASVSENQIAITDESVPIIKVNGASSPINGKVAKLYHESGELNVRVEFFLEGLRGGEKAELRFEYISPKYPTTLPNSAIHEDQYGKYILYAEKVKAALGYEFYARKMPVNLIENDRLRSAVNLYSSERIPVITNSDAPVSEGDKIRIVDGSDIVEIR